MYPDIFFFRILFLSYLYIAAITNGADYSNDGDP
jgi:hypothetical protein